MSNPRIKITIDQLVLRGFTPQQRQTVSGELQAELQRLLAGSLDIAELGNSRNLARLPHAKLGGNAGAASPGVGALAARHIVQEIKR